MSELSETFQALRELKKGKKSGNVESSLSWLKRAGIPYVVLNGANYHTLVAEKFDFWPSTGKWRKRGSNRWSRGVRSLIFAVKKELEK
jgi:hypothetical protein